MPRWMIPLLVLLACRSSQQSTQAPTSGGAAAYAVSVTSRGFEPTRAGGRPGRTALLAHPCPLDSSCWDKLMAECAALGWRVAAVDCPGFGGTPALGRPCTMDDLARLFAAALDALSAPAATLIGCSMGGYAMMAFWRLFPERMDRAALLCTQAGADSPEAKEKREQQARAALEKGP